MKISWCTHVVITVTGCKSSFWLCRTHHLLTNAPNLKITVNWRRVTIFALCNFVSCDVENFVCITGTQNESLPFCIVHKIVCAKCFINDQFTLSGGYLHRGLHEHHWSWLCELNVITLLQGSTCIMGWAWARLQHIGSTVQLLFRSESQWLSFPAPSVGLAQAWSHCCTHLLDEGEVTCENHFSFMTAF